jgi:hypothetical protein
MGIGNPSVCTLSPPPGQRAWLPRFLFVALLGSGCSTQDQYLVTTAQLAALRSPPATTSAPDAGAPDPESESAIPAQRRGGGQPVWLKRSAIDVSSATPGPAAPGAASPAGDHVLVRARAYSPALTAGATLTWVGTGISLIGSGLFLAGRIRGDNGLFLAGSFTALTAEPVMWAGIVYWFAATLRPAQEVAAPRR